MAEDLVHQNDEGADETSTGEEISVQEDFQAVSQNVNEAQAKFKGWANLAEREKSVIEKRIYSRIAMELIPLFHDVIGSTVTGFTGFEEILDQMLGDDGEEEGDAEEAAAPNELVLALYVTCRTCRSFLNAAVNGNVFKDPKQRAAAEKLVVMLMGIDTQGGGKDFPAEGDEKIKEEFDALFKP